MHLYPPPTVIYLIFSTFYLTYRDLRAVVPYFTYVLTSYAPSAGLKLTNLKSHALLTEQARCPISPRFPVSLFDMSLPFALSCLSSCWNLAWVLVLLSWFLDCALPLAHCPSNRSLKPQVPNAPLTNRTVGPPLPQGKIPGLVFTPTYLISFSSCNPKHIFSSGLLFQNLYPALGVARPASS